jgi:hypothetical protein
LEADECEELHRLVAAARVVATEGGGMDDVLPGRDFMADVKGGDDIVEH